jgi:hypothetical protein
MHDKSLLIVRELLETRKFAIQEQYWDMRYSDPERNNYKFKIEIFEELIELLEKTEDQLKNVKG